MFQGETIRFFGLKSLSLESLETLNERMKDKPPQNSKFVKDGWK